MGLADTFGAEDRVQVKFSDFYKLMKQATQYEIAMNAVGCDVPHRYIRECMTGVKEPQKQHCRMGRCGDGAVKPPRGDGSPR